MLRIASTWVPRDNSSEEHKGEDEALNSAFVEMRSIIKTDVSRLKVEMVRIGLTQDGLKAEWCCPRCATTMLIPTHFDAKVTNYLCPRIHFKVLKENETKEL